MEEFKSKFFSPLTKREYESLSDNLNEKINKRDSLCDAASIQKCLDELNKNLNRMSIDLSDIVGTSNQSVTPRSSLPSTPKLINTPKGNTLKESRLRTSLFDLDFDPKEKERGGGEKGGERGGERGVLERVSTPKRLSRRFSKRDELEREEREREREREMDDVAKVVSVCMSGDVSMKVTGACAHTHTHLYSLITR